MSEKNLNFDHPVERRGTHSLKYDFAEERGRKKVRGAEVRTGKTGSYDDADQRSGKKNPGTAEARGGIGCGYGRDRDPCKRLPSAGKCVADFE